MHALSHVLAFTSLVLAAFSSEPITRRVTQQQMGFRDRRVHEACQRTLGIVVRNACLSLAETACRSRTAKACGQAPAACWASSRG